MARRITGSNPFEEDEDNFEYIPREDGKSPFESRREQLSRLVDESEDRQLESTNRAIASLYESEAMGTATAEELLRQREVLNNIEKKTDDINSSLTSSQRHLNNIKSVFGGIKNWWGAKKDSKTEPAVAQQKSSLDKFVSRNTGSNSASEPRGQRWANGEMGEGLDNGFAAGSSRYGNDSRSAGQGSMQFIQPITRSAREEELDRNLGLMSDGLGRLKGLAQGLGEEIEQQNAQLDRINPKVQQADMLLDNQNKQMYKILGKK